YHPEVWVGMSLGPLDHYPPVPDYRIVQVFTMPLGGPDKAYRVVVEFRKGVELLDESGGRSYGARVYASLSAAERAEVDRLMSDEPVPAGALDEPSVAELERLLAELR